MALRFLPTSPILSLVLLALLARALRAQSASSRRPMVGAVGTDLMGYKLDTDVSQPARLDLDVRDVASLASKAKWRDATNVYAFGESSRTANNMRSLGKLSTEAATAMHTEGYFRLFRNFWSDDPTYADTFARSGLDGAGQVERRGTAFRAEIATKGAQYQNVWMYVVHNLEQAINDCERTKTAGATATATAAQSGVRRWDEAWALYTGSLVQQGADGWMPFTLAEKRCREFGTCEPSSPSTATPNGPRGEAAVNVRVLGLFTAGKRQLKAGECGGAVGTKNDIVKQMVVPLLQSLIRYVYKTKALEGVGPAGENDYERYHARGWAFGAAALPLVHNCDAKVADMIVDNFRPSEQQPMKASEKTFVTRVASVYRCLGLKCSDVGAFNEGGESKIKYPRCRESGRGYKEVVGTDRAAMLNEDKEVFAELKPVDPYNISSGLSGWAIVGIIVAVLLASGVVGAVMFFYMKSRRTKVVPDSMSGGSVDAEDEVFA